MIRHILQATDHRPWPLPEKPWVLKQKWHDLLFAHWPVPSSELRHLVPAAFELETFEDQAWVGVVPFRMSGVVPRFIPSLPFLSAFPEINVRTYVRFPTTGRSRPGVYFFSLDAANPISAAIARWAFHLPYHWARMSVKREDDAVRYSSSRLRGGEADFTATYRAIGGAFEAPLRTLEHWLCERYALYTVHKNRPYICEIHHRPWLLQAAEAEISVNTMAKAAGIRLPEAKPLLHFAADQDVVTWALEKL